MATAKCTFALFFGNRGFFPASFMESARKEMTAAVRKAGHKSIMLDAKATRHGAVETPQEGAKYAAFLEKNRGKFDGVICCLPNFGDETGAVAALKDADVPILVQAYPDELDKLHMSTRRDAFCGKFSVMDVFCQYGVPFTALRPHTAHPSSEAFAENLDYFSRMCSVVKALRSMTIGAIGARTTAFKTVRIDELALQRYGITMETVDLSDVFARMNALKTSDKTYTAKAKRLQDYADFKAVPKKAFDNIVRLGVVLDQYSSELDLDAMAIRCWIEMQQQLNISPCVLLSELNDRYQIAACEVDVGSAITMRALSAASGEVATCLDWNNNYGDEEDKCILFHCGPVPQSMMAGKGVVTDHEILANAVGKNCTHGCNVGRIKPMPMTFGNLMTEDGELKFYVGEGRFTEDPIPANFFGCAGVAQIDFLQDALLEIGAAGHRHHTAVTPSHVMDPVVEAFDKYLGYEVTAL